MADQPAWSVAIKIIHPSTGYLPLSVLLSLFPPLPPLPLYLKWKARELVRRSTSRPGVAMTRFPSSSPCHSIPSASSAISVCILALAGPLLLCSPSATYLKMERKRIGEVVNQSAGRCNDDLRKGTKLTLLGTRMNIETQQTNGNGTRKTDKNRQKREKNDEIRETEQQSMKKNSFLCSLRPPRKW